MLTLPRAIFWLLVGVLAVAVGAVVGGTLLPHDNSRDGPRRGLISLIIVGIFIVAGIIDREVFNAPDDD